MFYWLDIVQLALQQAGGQQGPAAVAAAQQLLKEKHSIFAARYRAFDYLSLKCFGYD